MAGSTDRSITETEYDSAYAQGAANTIQQKKIEGVPHVLIPPGSTLKSMAGLMDAPQRISASPTFFDTEGFIDYTAEFKIAGTRIFVDPEQRVFFTIFDAHAPGAPAWCEHSCSLMFSFSSEWMKLCTTDGKKMDPTTLSEFLEENVAYIEGPVKGADLLTMAQNLKVQLKGDLQVEHSTQSGLKKLLIKDDSTLRGSTGEKDLTFPEQVVFKMRIFDGGATYEVPVFLRYRAVKEGVTFWFKIPDRSAIEEAAFDIIIQDVKVKSGLKTLKGTYHTR